MKNNVLEALQKKEFEMLCQVKELFGKNGSARLHFGNYMAIHVLRSQKDSDAFGEFCH